MWLEKVAQFLIKGPILISKASSSFTVPFIIKMNFSSIKVHALLDSGAFACFINKDFVDCHKLPFITKKHPILVEIIDGRSLVLGDITQKTTLYSSRRHHSIIAFNVIKSPSNLLVLGLSWLHKYNLAIDWKTRRLAFQPNIISIQESGNKKTSSTPNHQQFKSYHRKYQRFKYH
jgi:hypothetical protein